MALLTGGTTAATSLSAIVFKPGMNSMTPADVASLNNGILDDLGNAHNKIPGSFSSGGQLFIPNRGVLQVLPGDYVMLDVTTGWPILVSARAIAAGPWAHS